jgi:hypothetical protein
MQDAAALGSSPDNIDLSGMIANIPDEMWDRADELSALGVTDELVEGEG